MAKTERKTDIEILYKRVNTVQKAGDVGGFSFYILFLFLLAGIYGLLHSFLTVFPVACDKEVVMAACGLITAAFLVLYVLRFWYPVSVGLFLIVVGCWLFLRWKQLSEQWVLIANEIRDKINHYYVADLPAFSVEGFQSTKATELLVLFMLLFGAMLFVGLIVRKSRLLTAMLLLFPTAGALLVGKVPDFWTLTLLVFCEIGACTVTRENFRETEVGEGEKGALGLSAIVAGILAAIAFAVSYFYITPAMEPVFENAPKLRQYVQTNTLSAILDERLPTLRFATSGVTYSDNGDFKNIGNISFTKEKALKVSLNRAPEETIYLKGYAGGAYTGESWESVDDDELSENAAIAAYAQAEALLPYLNGTNSHQMGVYNEPGIAGNFVPYISSIIEGEEISTYWRGEYEETMQTYDTSDIYGQLFPQDAYRQQVLPSYLEYPGERLPNLLALCKENPQKSIQDIRSFIQSSLERNAIYSLNPGICPDDKEFSEYFLFENKKGYCVHFATTGVLMFRMFGVPARYASGYMASQSDFKENEDGTYSAELTDERAHAWVEIYQDDLGWLPVEVTPGYTERNENTGETTVQTETPETEAKNTTDRESETITENPVQDKKTDGEILKKIGRIVGTAAGLVGVLALVYGTVILRRNRILQKRKSKKAKEVFRELCEALRLSGFAKEYDGTEGDFTDQICAYCPWIEKERMEQIMELVLADNYAKEPLTRAQSMEVRRLYEEVCGHLSPKLSPVKRLVFRYIKCYW